MSGESSDAVRERTGDDDNAAGEVRDLLDGELGLGRPRLREHSRHKLQRGVASAHGGLAVC